MLVIIIVITITIIVMIVTRVLGFGVLGFYVFFLMSEDRPIGQKDLYGKLVVFMCVCKCKFIES